MFPTLRPKLDLLEPAFVDRIIDEGYEVLEKTGIEIENDEALALLKAAGASVAPHSRRVRIPRPVMENLLAQAPSSFSLFDRSGLKAYRIGGDDVHFNPGSAGVRILDGGTERERPPRTADVVDFVRVADGCPHLNLQSTGLVAQDVPEVISDSWRVYIGLLFSAKPMITGTFRIEGFRPMHEMLCAVRGGADELRRKPLAVFDACPSPPLRWSRLTSQILLDCARAGIPSELVAMGMTGATSPVTIAGTLVQHVAENLAGLAMAQAASSGAPIIFGGSPSSFDMRKGTTPMGAMETMMIDAAAAQVGKRLKLPTHAYMALSDAKRNDSQAGFETALGAVLAALAGINIVSGPGMLDYETTISLEKLLIDDEICALSYRLLAGIAQREDPIAAPLFESIDPEAKFLVHDHTRRWYRQEHSQARLVDRDPYEAWAAAGAATMADRARDEVKRLLSAPPAGRAPEALAADLRRIMDAEAARCGLPALPAV